jgi:hypothetical protein
MNPHWGKLRCGTQVIEEKFMLIRVKVNRLAGKAAGLGLLLCAMTISAHAQARLDGVIDIHAHTDPDIAPRSIDAIDLARVAKQRGMRGLVLKNHYESTAAQAYLIRKEVPGIEVFGGIDLNRTVGGINPAAVEQMAKLKGGWGKVIWLPTYDSENSVRILKQNRPFVPVARDGHVLPEVEQVMDLAVKYHLLLETGHSSAEEGLLLVREAKKRGVQNVVVTHAMTSVVRMTVPQMREAASLGAYIEFVYSATIGADNPPSMADYASAIRAIGPRSCILSSDLGKASDPIHPDGLVLFFEGLRKEGISQSDIDLMSKTNPANVLGLQ